jgi:hypothetical protein
MPLYLSTQYHILNKAYHTFNVYQELKAEMLTFFQRQRAGHGECHDHVCNVLIYQLTGYMGLKDHILQMEKYIDGLDTTIRLLKHIATVDRIRDLWLDKCCFGRILTLMKVLLLNRVL